MLTFSPIKHLKSGTRPSYNIVLDYSIIKTIKEYLEFSQFFLINPFTTRWKGESKTVISPLKSAHEILRK